MIHYLLEQWPYLLGYLEDRWLEISNNRAERSIKPFVIDRKDFLFANTPGGAQGSAIIFSMMETAKENGARSIQVSALHSADSTEDGSGTGCAAAVAVECSVE